MQCFNFTRPHSHFFSSFFFVSGKLKEVKSSPTKPSLLRTNNSTFPRDFRIIMSKFDFPRSLLTHSLTLLLSFSFLFPLSFFLSSGVLFHILRSGLKVPKGVLDSLLLFTPDSIRLLLHSLPLSHSLTLL